MAHCPSAANRRRPWRRDHPLLTAGRYLRRASQTQSEASRHHCHHQVKRCHSFGNQRFLINLAQKPFNLPRIAFARLRVSFWPTSGALAPLHTLKPWAAALITPQLHMQTVAGVEEFLDMSAQKGSKRLAYLETATDVEPLLGVVPMEDVISMLRYTLDDLSAPQQFLEQLYR